MAQYLLLTQHVINNVLLERGTLIGTGTAWPFSAVPTPEMLPQDAPAQAAMEKYQAQIFTGAPAAISSPTVVPSSTAAPKAVVGFPTPLVFFKQNDSSSQSGKSLPKASSGK